MIANLLTLFSSLEISPAIKAGKLFPDPKPLIQILTL
jgi:hypothetical protein